ncbi:MAG: hypothetical protein ACK4F9_04535 [Brevinematia bacterium]
MKLIDTILTFSTLPLIPISVISIIAIIVLISLEKEIKPFLILVLLISLSLLSYLVSDFLLSFFGFNTGDIQSIENNKNIIILLSKVEILCLVLGIIFFSSISLLFTPTIFSKIKSIVIVALGIYIIFLDFLSDKFFLKDTLKLNINKYMGMEGPLFDIFVIYFGSTVLFETFYLYIIKNKVNPKYTSVYKTAIYGMIIVIIFGILELLELYDIIGIYPYSPSLLGTGIMLFSVTILVILIIRYSDNIILNKKLSKIIQNAKEKTDINLGNVKKTINESINQINIVSDKAKEILNLPSLTESIINKTNDSLQNAKNISSKISQVLSLEIDSLLNKIEKLDSKIQSRKDFSEKIKEITKEEKKIISNIGNISIHLISKKQDQITEISKLTQSDTIVEISNFLQKVESYLEDTKVQLINTLIVIEKNGQTELKHLSILSNEMLDKVNNLREILKEISLKNQELLSIQEKNKPSPYKEGSKKSEIELLELKNQILDNIEKLTTTNTNVENQLKTLKNSYTKIISLSNSFKYNIDTIENGIKNLSNIAQEFQTIHEQFSSITNSIQEINLNIEKLKSKLEEFNLELSR